MSESPPTSRSIPPAPATLSVEPDVVEPGAAFLLTVKLTGSADLSWGQALKMRPVEGDENTRDQQTYTLIGVRPGTERDPEKSSFGPNETPKVLDIGYSGDLPLEFVVPRHADAQVYELTLEILEVIPEGGTSRGSAKTTLTVS